MKTPNKNDEGRSGDFGTEDVGAQIAPRDALLGHVFDRRPIGSFEKGSFVDPVRNELLANTSSVRIVGPRKVFRHAISKRGLATSDLDGALERSNVVSFHEHELYKLACAQVNKPTRMTTHKTPCKVLAMPATRRKPVKGKPEKTLAIGVDGRTANARFREAFADWANGDRSKTQTELVRLCNVIAGRPADADKPFVSQQIIDQIIREEIDASRSSFLDVLAEALDVRAVWLRLGVGERRPDSAVLDRLRELLRAKA